VLEFIDLNDINILVVDNCTTENGIHSYLSSLPSFVDIKTYKKREPNELHRSMNYAINYSKKKGNKYINFIQDDYQYLSTINDFNKKIHDVFVKCPKIIQVQTNLVWKYKSHKIGEYSPVMVSDTKWYCLHNKSACDNGITRVSVYDKIGMYPTNVSVHGREKKYVSGESWFAKKTKGYKRMLLSEPNMSMIIDCAFIRGNKRIGRYFCPPGKYYLKTFDENKKNIIRMKRDKNKICFVEELAEPDGWKPDALQKHNKRKIITEL
jgi:hypothetical protein